MFLTKSLKQGAKATLSFFTALWMSTAALFAGASTLDLPSEIARVEKAEAGQNGKTAFLIQEAHVDYNAQKAISEIIRHLAQKKSLRLILVEGGWGDTSLSFLRSYGSSEGRLEVAERYLKEGKISGEEYLDIVSDLDMRFWGIENPDDYRRNMEVFLKFHEVQDKLLTEVEKLKETLLSLEDKVFSPPAKEFEAARNGFRENQSSIIQYAHFLKPKVEAAALDSFPQLKHLMALGGAEKSFDPDKVEREKQELIQALSRTVSRFELDRISLLKERKNPEDELEFIRALLRLSKTHERKLRKVSVKNLIRYFDILESLFQNDASAVFKEIKTLEQAAFKELQLSDDEKTLFELINSVELLEKLFRLEMSPDDFEALEKNPSTLNPLSWEEFLNHQAVIASPSGEPSSRAPKGRGDLSAEIASSASLPRNDVVDINFTFLNEWIDDAKAFYTSALARENALIQNAIRKIEETKADQAAILAGGFHTEHLAKALKERGFSYFIISPRFVPADPKDHGRKYFEILKYKWGQGPNLTSNPSQGG